MNFLMGVLGQQLRKHIQDQLELKPTRALLDHGP